ncbi:membrane protein insertion efficiency factor YidD [Candidatus Curtissbacteria bacterium RIFCSPHIGHO2_01_FULL_41_11]|uniref:Membrane protein insertion efficiency factor YidD n=1 Tax=Candidatus Curtissbacteria bacterium RIFCSPHIGHO2_01_FULL_41_11 TaxID=1797711 RepID=A0A1F5G6R8_9BACT|nr:MAG: membrane protein insertion efficiency factor YidD [Candidatus Curtissbacteria bacterium RIFCSPHIGHO2_01_FULL_41_11]
MTQKIAKKLFRLYHLVFASTNANCRFHPTCSKYALDAIEKYGVAKGTYLAAVRILNCHPFTKRPIYDPA